MSNKFLSAVTFDEGLAQSVTFSFISTDDLPAIAFSGLSDVSVSGVVNASILYYKASDSKWHALSPYGFGSAVLTITGIGQLPSWQPNTLPSNLVYTDAANVFETVPQSVTVAGKTLQIKDTKTITTDNTELVLEETGDTVGTVRLRLQNRTNSNGAIFENTAVNLVDFGFIPSAGTGSQQNIRLENRAGSETVIASPEFQIGGTGGPGLVVSGANAAVFAHNSSTNPTLGAYNYTSVATHRQQWKAVGSWPTSTDASRKARVVFSVYDTAARECFRMEASGSAAMISFFGGGAVVQQTGDIGDALVAYGLLTSPSLKVANGGTGNAKGSPIGLFDHYASQGNGTTLETDLYNDSIAAGQLANNGEKLAVEYGGLFVSSATATRQIKLYFGVVNIFDTGALTLSLSSAWTMYASFVRVSASVVRYMISFTTEGAALAAYTAVGELTGLTLSGAYNLRITAQAAGVGAATNDIVAMLGSVSWVPAAA